MYFQKSKDGFHITVTRQPIIFPAQGAQVAGILYLPEQADDSRKLPAIVCVHPGSSCKDQTAGIYAGKLAKLGYITLAFDASYQGASHYDLYDQPEPVKQAVEKLGAFYKENL